jgi:spermidine/putrescine transport system ATP-binding protein
MPDSDNTVQMVSVTKTFGQAAAVDDVNLTVARGEFFSLLGPSGCGKTTSLRMLAGFISPDSGRILLEGRDVTDVPPYRREVNTVFQSYALFAHLTVAGNIAFGLKRKKVPKHDIRRRVGDMLELVGLLDRADAKPEQLSGGQRQRVALARSLVNMPKVLLLDEPLGALDLKLRRAMQIELKRIQRDVGITFVYVTHDQEEALTMSDRIGVMNAGRLEQVGVPATLYEEPATGFVAGFIGTSNLLEGTRVADGVRLRDGLTVPVPSSRSGPVTSPGDQVMISLRPENILLDRELTGRGVSLRGRIAEIIYLGSLIQYTVECHGMALTVTEPNRPDAVARGHRINDEVSVSWSERHTVVLPRNADAQATGANETAVQEAPPQHAPADPPAPLAEPGRPDDFQEPTWV